jgi:hypothetical protein
MAKTLSGRSLATCQGLNELSVTMLTGKITIGSRLAVRRDWRQPTVIVNHWTEEISNAKELTTAESLKTRIITAIPVLQRQQRLPQLLQVRLYMGLLQHPRNETGVEVLTLRMKLPIIDALPNKMWRMQHRLLLRLLHL